jgi:hypothetical protein
MQPSVFGTSYGVVELEPRAFLDAVLRVFTTKAGATATRLPMR